MDLAWILLIFIVVAAITVGASIIVQHLSVGRSHSPHEYASPRLLDHMARPQGDDARLDDTDPHGIQIFWHTSERSPAGEESAGHSDSRQAHTRQARADELEAVAERERRYAERAEAEARRLRESNPRDVAGTPTEQHQRRRRAGIAPEDLDY